MVFGLEKTLIWKRLNKHDLTTFETRRLRGDLIEISKNIKGFDNVDYERFF